MRFPKKAVWVFFALLAIIIAIAWIMATRPPPPRLPVTIFPPGYKIPPQKASIPDRWISRKWGWYWRLKQRVFGPPKIVTLGATVFEYSAPPEEVLSSLGVGEATFTNTSGVHIWITNHTGITAMEERVTHSTNRFRVTAAPRITSADAAQSRIMSSWRVSVAGVATDVGVVLGCLPRVHKDSTDLTVVLRVTEAITNSGPETFASSNGVVSVATNFEVAARLQIPREGGVLLLDGTHSSNSGKATAVFISTDSAPPKSGFSSRVRAIVSTPPAPRAP